MNNLPKLQIVPIKKLKLHETTDSIRVDKLEKIIKKAKVFTNPPIVSYLPRVGRYMVLDGANRTTVLKKLDFKYILVQVVKYKPGLVDLTTWNHFVSKITLSKAIELLGNQSKTIQLLKTKSISLVDKLMKNKKSLLYITDGRLYYVILNSGRLKDDVVILNLVVNIYKGKYSFGRVLVSDYQILKKEHHGKKLLFVYKKMTHQDIVRIVRNNLYVPSGITRHLVRGRVLRVDIPINLLKGKKSLVEVNNKLNNLIKERLLLGQIRYYNEPTFIFND